MGTANPGINALFERAPLTIGDEATFSEVKGAVERSFSTANVKAFLKALQARGLRIREFETVVQAGVLGPRAAVDYARLANGDQGMIREMYLALLEKVDLDLRNKFFKLYAYY